MDIKGAIKVRHSVRQYQDKAIPAEIIAELQGEIDQCNQESGLHIQMVTGEKEAFGGMMARYGSFRGVANYIALIGIKSNRLAETAGYYGERIALKAQQLGLNTCWVALTFSKKKCKASIGDGEKMVCVLSLGYGVNQGKPHKSKAMMQLCDVSGEMPDWFREGMEAALLAPTAVNQQKFMVSMEGETIKVKATGGVHSDIDLGIVKYHLEIGSEKEVVTE